MDTVEEYLQKFPPEVRSILQRLRDIVKRNATSVFEYIAYKMPAYKLDGRLLIYFAAYAHHIGLYGIPTGHSSFKAAFAPYKQGKGSIQFPLDRPIPFALIEQIVQFRIQEIQGSE